MAQQRNQQQQRGGGGGAASGLAAHPAIQNVRGKIDAYSGMLEQWVDRTPMANRYLSMASSKTGVKKSNILLAAVGFIGVYLAFGPAAGLICNLFGFVYPAYASVQAIESHNKEDDTKWLTYWVVFAFLSIVEHFSSFILSWVPFYWLLKCLLLVWLFSPVENNGSLFVYYKFIRPFALKYLDRSMAGNPNVRGPNSSGGGIGQRAGGGQMYPNEDINKAQ